MSDILDYDNSYVSLEKIAAKLRLPKSYLRCLAKSGEIPHLLVGGKLRFSLKSVQQGLDALAKSDRREVYSERTS